MRVGCQALPRERWESLLGVVSCLQALLRLFLWRWRGRKLWLESSLHWSEDPSHLSTALPCSQLPGFCRQKMWCIQMHSIQRDHLHVGCWRHVGEAQSWCCWCTGERVSVRWFLPSRIFTFLLKWPSSFTLADLSCRKHRIHLYILPETPLSSIFSRRPSRQTLSKAFVSQRKQRQPFSFLERHSLSPGPWGPADLLCFCVSDIQSVLVTVFSVLPKMISIFCWLLALEVFQSNLGGWWGGSCLGLSCLCLFYGLGWWWLFSINRNCAILPRFVEELKKCFTGSRSKVFNHVICDTIWSWCLLALQLFYCCFNLFHGDGLAHAVVWCGLLLQLC